jgi:hypothetical protein
MQDSKAGRSTKVPGAGGTGFAGGLPSKLKSDCMIPHLQPRINGLMRVCALDPEKQKAARGRPYCVEFANFYRTIELPELVTVIGLPALTTWALWA